MQNITVRIPDSPDHDSDSEQEKELEQIAADAQKKLEALKAKKEAKQKMKEQTMTEVLDAVKAKIDEMPPVDKSLINWVKTHNAGALVNFVEALHVFQSTCKVDVQMPKTPDASVVTPDGPLQIVMAVDGNAQGGSPIKNVVPVHMVKNVLVDDQAGLSSHVVKKKLNRKNVTVAHGPWTSALKTDGVWMNDVYEQWTKNSMTALEKPPTSVQLKAEETRSIDAAKNVDNKLPPIFIAEKQRELRNIDTAMHALWNSLTRQTQEKYKNKQEENDKLISDIALEDEKLFDWFSSLNGMMMENLNNPYANAGLGLLLNFEETLSRLSREQINTIIIEVFSDNSCTYPSPALTTELATKYVNIIFELLSSAAEKVQFFKSNDGLDSKYKKILDRPLCSGKSRPDQAHEKNQVALVLFAAGKVKEENSDEGVSFIWKHDAAVCPNCKSGSICLDMCKESSVEKKKLQATKKKEAEAQRKLASAIASSAAVPVSIGGVLLPEVSAAVPAGTPDICQPAPPDTPYPTNIAPNVYDEELPAAKKQRVGDTTELAALKKFLKKEMLLIVDEMSDDFKRDMKAKLEGKYKLDGAQMIVWLEDRFIAKPNIRMDGKLLQYFTTENMENPHIEICASQQSFVMSVFRNAIKAHVNV